MASARNFFNEQEQNLLVKAIEEAERNSSGEIRLHLTGYCFGSEVKAAQKIFKRLNMHTTKDRNGVLFYIATRSKKIAIVGDKGIHEKLGHDYWQAIISRLINQFKGNNKAEVLIACIKDCGEQLGKFFPLNADDKNELSNSISF